MSMVITPGRGVLRRICVLNHRTDQARVDEAIGALRRHGVALSAATTDV